MQQSFLRKLNIRDKEGGLSILLFISAFFLGGFICSYDIVSHAIFFERWSQQDFSMVYLFSGGFGIVLFSIYTFLHKRLSYKLFHFINTTLVMGLVVAFFTLYIIRPDEIISFAGLALMFPVNLLAMLTFWRFKRKLLLPEQTKRIFPFVEFGFVAGVVVVCAGIFLLLRNYTYHIIIPAAIFSVAIVFLLQFPIDMVHRSVRIFNHKKEQRVPVKASPFILWSTKFTRNLLLFTVMSALVGFFLHYGFINLFRIRYNEVAQFSTGALGTHVYFSGGGLDAFRHVFPYVARSQLCYRLPDNLAGFLDFSYANHVTIPAGSDGPVLSKAYADIKIEILVSEIGFILANVEFHPASAQVRPGDPVADCPVGRNNPHFGGAFDENEVVG